MRSISTAVLRTPASTCSSNVATTATSCSRARFAHRGDERPVDRLREREVGHRIAGLPHLWEQHDVGTEGGAVSDRGGAVAARGQLRQRDAEHGHVSLSHGSISSVISLLDGIATTRAIRRYTTDPIPEDDLATIMFAASRAPSGSNRQPFRFLVLRDGPKAVEAKRLLGNAFRAGWSAKVASDGYEGGSGRDETSAKARMARTMQHYVDHFEEIPVVVLACLVRYRDVHYTEGALHLPRLPESAARRPCALGYGGLREAHAFVVEPELRELLEIPDYVGAAPTSRSASPRAITTAAPGAARSEESCRRRRGVATRCGPSTRADARSTLGWHAAGSRASARPPNGAAHRCGRILFANTERPPPKRS